MGLSFIQGATCNCRLCQVFVGDPQDPGCQRGEGLCGLGGQAEGLPQLQPDQEEHEQLKNCGLDLYEGVVRDNEKAGVFEPAISKIKSLKFATEAAITILRIDDMIKLAPERGEEKSYQQAYADGSLNG